VWVLVAVLVAFLLVAAFAAGLLVGRRMRHAPPPVVDPLTGALTRAALSARLAELAVQATGSSRPLCVLVCDLDLFKRVNDAHGHARGDRVLREAAETMRHELRGFDALYRPGGEEFVVVLPGLDAEQGALIAERLRAAVEAARPGALRVTASFGAAAGSDPHALLEAADRALYASKRAGRNRVSVIAPGQREPVSFFRLPSAV
jgi:diguanylate cyclase (GGDEF)-like protein